jgi:UPF0716 protein FxsA
MGLRGRLLVFGYPALEILTAWGLASVIGWGWTIVVLLAGLPVGALLMRSASRGAVGEFQTAARTGATPRATARYASRFAAGLLLAIPGVWSDLAAVLVLVPGSGRWMLRKLPTPRYQTTGTWTWSAWSTATMGQGYGWGPVEGDIVEGQVINRPAGPSGDDGPAGDLSNYRGLPG